MRMYRRMTERDHKYCLNNYEICLLSVRFIFVLQSLNGDSSIICRSVQNRSSIFLGIWEPEIGTSAGTFLG